MSSYNKVVKGKLSFKGSKNNVSLKTKQPAGSNGNNRSISISSSTISSSTGSSASTSSNCTQLLNKEDEPLQIITGTGRMTTSGVTVHGHGTLFIEELGVGDAIMIIHPTTLTEETKIVRMVLSNISIGISSAFSTDLISQTAFKYIKVPKEEDEEVLAKAEREEGVQRKRKADEVEEHAFGTYASAGGEKAVYRVKKPGAHGGYKIITETATKNLSREELLSLRSKKKADRHCY